MFLFFILSLISKPMAVTLPVVLLILDYYPLEKIKDTKKAVLEKVPLFVLSGLSSVITLWAQQTGGAIIALDIHPLSDRIFVAVRAYIFYLYKMILPLDLAPLYPLPKNPNLFTLEYAGSIILFFAITCFCILSLKKRKIFALVWFYYVITLVPVIGIVQVGIQAAADRYTYLPGLGPFILIGFGAGVLYEKFPKRACKATLFVFVIIILGLFGYRTVLQTTIWKDPVTLWSYEIRLFPEGAAISHNNLGIAYGSLGRYQEAIMEFQTALRLNPNYAEVHYNLGNAYKSIGQYDEAVAHYYDELQINPNNADIHNNLGNALAKQGKIKEALAGFTKALLIKPNYAKAHYNMGVILAQQEKLDEAIAHFSEAIRVKPDYTEAHYNIGLVYGMKGLNDMAMTEMRKANKLDPSFLKNTIREKKE